MDQFCLPPARPRPPPTAYPTPASDDDWPHQRETGRQLTIGESYKRASANATPKSIAKKKKKKKKQQQPPKETTTSDQSR